MITHFHQLCRLGDGKLRNERNRIWEMKLTGISLLMTNGKRVQGFCNAVGPDENII